MSRDETQGVKIQELIRYPINIQISTCMCLYGGKLNLTELMYSGSLCDEYYRESRYILLYILLNSTLMIIPWVWFFATTSSVTGSIETCDVILGRLTDVLDISVLEDWMIWLVIDDCDFCLSNNRLLRISSSSKSPSISPIKWLWAFAGVGLIAISGI